MSPRRDIKAAVSRIFVVRKRAVPGIVRMSRVVPGFVIPNLVFPQSLREPQAGPRRNIERLLPKHPRPGELMDRVRRAHPVVDELMLVLFPRGN